MVCALKVGGIGPAMQQLGPHAHALERLLNVAALERLRPKLGAVGGAMAKDLCGRGTAAASEVLYDFFMEEPSASQASQLRRAGFPIERY